MTRRYALGAASNAVAEKGRGRVSEASSAADGEQIIRFRLSVDITRPDAETAKDISEELQAVVNQIEGVESVKELGWRRLRDDEALGG